MTEDRGRLFEIAKTVIVVVLIAVLVRSFIVQTFYVSGASMEPSYHDGEYLLVDKLSYHFRAPRRGEVIILQFPKDERKDFIKRVIGLPGERVEVRGGAVYIDGRALDEPYLSGANVTSGGDPVKLGEDEFYVLGDNRNNSSDSRSWGVLPRRDVLGRSWLRFWPPGKTGLAARPSY